MTRCTEMDDEAHAVLHEITKKGVTKAQIAKTSPTSLANDFDLPRQEVRMLLEDLQACGFLRIGHDSRIYVYQTCSCLPQISMLDKPRGPVVSRGHDQARRHDGSSQGESPSPYGGGTSPPVRHAESEILHEPHDSEELPRRTRVSPEPGRAVGKHGNKQPKGPPESAFELALMLRREVRAMSRKHGVVWTGGVATSAVRNEMARWLRDGDVTPAIIRAMITEFCRTPGWIREGRPAWQTFLAQRQALTNRAVQAAQESDPRSTEEDWLAFTEQPEKTEEEWLSW